MRHALDFRKIAVVGDKTWEEWMVKLMKPFTSGEVEYFAMEEKKKAWAWVGSP